MCGLGSFGLQFLGVSVCRDATIARCHCQNTNTLSSSTLCRTRLLTRTWMQGINDPYCLNSFILSTLKTVDDQHMEALQRVAMTHNFCGWTKIQLSPSPGPRFKTGQYSLYIVSVKPKLKDILFKVVVHFVVYKL